MDTEEGTFLLFTICALLKQTSNNVRIILIATPPGAICAISCNQGRTASRSRRTPRELAGVNLIYLFCCLLVRAFPLQILPTHPSTAKNDRVHACARLLARSGQKVQKNKNTPFIIRPCLSLSHHQTRGLPTREPF